MTRSATLPSGVATEATAAQYLAVHCVEIGYSTPVRVTDGAATVTIDGNAYSPWQIDIAEMPIGDAGASIMLRLANTDQSLSTKDLSEDSRGKEVKVYEVFWSSAGSQLSPVKAWSGIVSEVLWSEDVIEYSVRLLPASASDMVGVIAQRLCTHVFRGLRCSYNEVAAPTFTRATTGYNQSGVQSSSGVGRYDVVRVDRGICIEEACTNLLTANQASVETDTTGFTLTGSTITRDSTYAWTGTYALKIVTSNAATEEGAYTTNTTVTASNSFTASVWARGSGTVKVGINERTAADANVGTTYSSAVALSSTAWTRFTVTRAFGATGERARVYLVTSSQQSATFYGDGWQIEQKAYPTSWQLPGSTRNAETLAVPAAAVPATTGSVSLWLKLNRSPGTSSQYFLANGGSANNTLQLYVNTSGKVVLVYGTGSTTVTKTSTGSSLVTGTVYHVAATWSASGCALYQDGTSVGTDATAPSITHGSNVYLGSAAAGNLQLGGWLDEVVFFNTALTSTQVAALAASVGPASVGTTTKYYLPADGDLRHAEGTGSQSCDHTYATCTTLSNTTRFGGVARFAPRLGQRVSYKLVRQVGVSVSAGTSAPAATAPTTTSSTGTGTVRKRL